MTKKNNNRNTQKGSEVKTIFWAVAFALTCVVPFGAFVLSFPLRSGVITGVLAVVTVLSWIVCAEMLYKLTK